MPAQVDSLLQGNDDKMWMTETTLSEEEVKPFHS